MCKQHVTVVAAGSVASENYVIYSFMYRDIHLRGQEMIHGRGKRKNKVLIQKLVFGFWTFFPLIFDFC